MTKLANLINPEVMGDIISAELQRLLNLAQWLRLIPH